MNAAFFRTHGNPEVMEYGTVPDSETPLGADEVQIRIKAGALNRLDKWVRDGWPGLKLALPHIGGSDGAGEVAAVGAAVTRFKVGDRVVINANLGCGQCAYCRSGLDNQCDNWHLLGETTPGTLAEYLVIPEKQVLHLPDDVAYESAAAVGLVYLTAWHSLITRGRLKAGESVLVVGAAGGVNTASIQIAKFAGCRVYVVGSDEHKLELASKLGADVLIDRSKSDWGKQVYQLTQKRGVDVVVDNVGAPTMMTSLRCARKGGRVLTVGNTGGPKFEIDNRFFFARHVSLIGSTMGTLTEFEIVMGLVFNGTLKPVIDSILPLSEIRAAHEKLERGDTLGKIVLTV